MDIKNPSMTAQQIALLIDSAADSMRRCDLDGNDFAAIFIFLRKLADYWGISDELVQASLDICLTRDHEIVKRTCNQCGAPRPKR